VIRHSMSNRERHSTVTEEFVHLVERVAPRDRIVAEAMRLIARTPCDAGVRTTRLALEVGERQLRRRFLYAVGYGPKRFMRIVRFQRLLDLMRINRADRNWVCLALEVGERQLRRRFLHAVGYGPKRFMRIVRFQRLLDLIRMNRTDRDWVRLALDAGYADQAHMINDVRSIAGVSPRNLGL